MGHISMVSDMIAIWFGRGWGSGSHVISGTSAMHDFKDWTPSLSPWDLNSLRYPKLLLTRLPSTNFWFTMTGIPVTNGILPNHWPVFLDGWVSMYSDICIGDIDSTVCVCCFKPLYDLIGSFCKCWCSFCVYYIFHGILWDNYQCILPHFILSGPLQCK